MAALAGFLGPLPPSSETRREVLSAMATALEHRGVECAFHDDGELALVSRWARRESPPLSGPQAQVAFALTDGAGCGVSWDPCERRLVLERHAAAVLPLYWCRQGETVLFGPELKALQAHAACPRTILWSAEAAGSDPRSTLLSDVRQLAAGGSVSFEGRDVVRVTAAMNDAPSVTLEALAELAAASVETALPRPVPLAVSTDGGLAALALLTAVACRHRPGRLWLLDPAGPAGRAAALAALFEQAFGVPVTALALDVDPPGVELDSLERLVWLSERPFLEPGVVVQAALLEQLRVVAGDEVALLSGLGATALPTRSPREAGMEHQRVPLSLRPFLGEATSAPGGSRAEIAAHASGLARVASACGVSLVTPFADPRFVDAERVRAALWGQARRVLPDPACAQLRELERDTERAARDAALTHHVVRSVIAPFLERYCGQPDSMFSAYKLGAAARALRAPAGSAVAERLIETIVTCVTTAIFARRFGS